jgi:hypothetical protein
MTYLCPGQIAPRATIGALPDGVLLDIFDFWRESKIHFLWRSWPGTWRALTHVCQRWRYVVLASPNRLNLVLLCTERTPVREMLGIWPAWPIELRSESSDGGDNIIAALEHHDRIRRIWSKVPSSPLLERFATVMQGPFPELSFLQLISDDKTPAALPDTFLGGSSPRLRRLCLRNILFPALPTLLLSCSDLVDLYLLRIPNTGYISPEAMVTGLSALTRLERLFIIFESPPSRPDRRTRCPPPSTRAVLPALTEFYFRGVSEYLEDLVARIRAPLLRHLNITFFNQLIFDIRHLPLFICHTGMPRSFSHARLGFVYDGIEIALDQIGMFQTIPLPRLKLGIKCGGLDWQVSSMAQIFSQFSSLLSSAEQLDISGHHDPTLQVDMNNTQWLELFHAFIAVRTLRISHPLRSLIVPALQELTGEMATEVLPALDSLYLGEYKPIVSEQQAIEPFITARRSYNHPLSIHPLSYQNCLDMLTFSRVVPIG